MRIQKRHWIVIALILLLLLFAEVWEYVRVTGEDNQASAVTVGTPNPGHTWSSMECNADTLCIDTTNKFVGIGTNSPAVKLDVNGAIKIGTQTTCDSASEGAIRYMSGYIQVCYGSKWHGLINNSPCSPSPAGATSCQMSGLTVTVSYATPGSYSWTAPSGVNAVQYLVVAGGGGSGGTWNSCSAGGGAGGFLTSSITVTPLSAYTITVGGGGIAGTRVETLACQGGNGGNSSFGTITTSGGGGGGGSCVPSAFYGASGGSGGGGFNGYGAGTGISGQGYAGFTASSFACGGGGGAGGIATSATGGYGVYSDISGTSSVYATGGTGGIGVGAGTGFGSGAGGGAANSAGYSGNSGIVILKYVLPS